MYLLVWGSHVSCSEFHRHLHGHSFHQEGHNNTAELLICTTQCLLHPSQGQQTALAAPSPASRTDKRDFTPWNVNLFSQEFELRALPHQGKLRENPCGISTLSHKVSPVFSAAPLLQESKPCFLGFTNMESVEIVCKMGFQLHLSWNY